MSEWQPIETAPTDGTKILLYRIHTNIEVGEFYWFEREVFDPTSDGLYRKRIQIYGQNWNATGRPTHWMPLPSPPST